MRKEVLIIIEGIQSGDVKQTVTSRAEGIYQYQNGKHYIRYEEKAEEGTGRIKNTLKLSAEQMVIKKEGPGVSTQMVFNPSEETYADYQTPYGNLSFRISNSIILMTEEENEIRVILRYRLSDQGGLLSENQVKIRVSSL